MYRLVIDIGNTNTKLAVFQERTMVLHQRLQRVDTAYLEELLAAYDISYFTISSVNTNMESLVDFLKQRCRYVPFSTQTDAGIISRYTTPETLGPDRWAKVIAAKCLYPGQSCLLIDAGTCITYDVLTADGVYQGGSISPGIRMRFEALHHYTRKLPLVEWDKATGIPEGTDTLKAIQRGVLQGMACEVEGIIAAESKKNKGLRVLFTGGDADFLTEPLKNSIFASQITYDPYLVLKGLNEVIT